MPTDYINVYYQAIDKKYGAGTKEAKYAKYKFRYGHDSIEKDLLPKYLHGIYDEIAVKGGNKKKIDTPDEIDDFHERAFYTFDRAKVPSCLLEDYDKIAKTNKNNIIDTKKEAYKFQDKVKDAYNYGKISLNTVKSLGFNGYKKQGLKTGEYAENGAIMGYQLMPIPGIDFITGAAGGIIGGAVGLIHDGAELVKEKCCGKKNNDLIGIESHDCITMNEDMHRMLHY